MINGSPVPKWAAPIVLMEHFGITYEEYENTPDEVIDQMCVYLSTKTAAERKRSKPNGSRG